MESEQIKIYFELLNGVVGILIFLMTLMVFRFSQKNPDLIKSYLFLKSGRLSRSFFYMMMGMLIWGIREIYKVLEIEGFVKLNLFYEMTELVAAVFLLIGMSNILIITKTKRQTL